MLSKLNELRNLLANLEEDTVYSMAPEPLSNLMLLMTLVGLNDELERKLWKLWDKLRQPLLLIPLIGHSDKEAFRILASLEPSLPKPITNSEKVNLINMLARSGLYELAVAEISEGIRSGNLSREEKLQLKAFLGYCHLKLQEEREAVDILKEICQDSLQFEDLLKVRYNLSLALSYKLLLEELAELFCRKLILTLLESLVDSQVRTALELHIKALRELSGEPIKMIDAMLGIITHSLISGYDIRYVKPVPLHRVLTPLNECQSLLKRYLISVYSHLKLQHDSLEAKNSGLESFLIGYNYMRAVMLRAMLSYRSTSLN